LVGYIKREGYEGVLEFPW